jgi:hypothetical protein
MTQPEFWPELGIELPDDTQEELLNLIFFDIIGNYNESMLNADDEKGIITLGPTERMELKASVMYHVVNLRVGTKFIEIGYFNPALGEFVAYPELLDELQMSVLQAKAMDLYESGIAADNGTYVDYRHDDIKALHQSHNAALQESGIPHAIMEMHNNREGVTRDDRIEADQATSMAVCILGGSGFRTKGSKLAIKILGGFRFEANGFKKRVAQKDLIVAEFNADNDDYVATSQSYATPMDIAALEELAEEAEVLKVTTHPDLNLKKLGIEIKPQE